LIAILPCHPSKGLSLWMKQHLNKIWFQSY